MNDLEQQIRTMFDDRTYEFFMNTPAGQGLSREPTAAELRQMERRYRREGLREVTVTIIIRNESSESLHGFRYCIEFLSSELVRPRYQGPLPAEYVAIDLRASMITLRAWIPPRGRLWLAGVLPPRTVVMGIGPDRQYRLAGSRNFIDFLAVRTDRGETEDGSHGDNSHSLGLSAEHGGFGASGEVGVTRGTSNSNTMPRMSSGFRIQQVR